MQMATSNSFTRVLNSPGGGAYIYMTSSKKESKVKLYLQNTNNQSIKHKIFLKIVTLKFNTLILTSFLFAKTPWKLSFWYVGKLRHYINYHPCLQTPFSRDDFQFKKHKKVAQSSVKWIWRKMHLHNLVFHQKLLNKLSWVCKCIVTVNLPLAHGSIAKHQRDGAIFPSQLFSNSLTSGDIFMH